MRRLGLLGGMSWESSSLYYQLLNRGVRERLGGLSSADCVLHSLNFAEVEALQRSGRWEQAGELLVSAARGLEGAGAEALLLCTNTMHKVADQLAAGVSLPLLHIADATGLAVQKAGLQKVLLLGTRFTMCEDFFRERLQQKFGLQIVLPDAAAQSEVHRIIFDELCLGKTEPDSKETYLKIIAGIQGLEAVIFGCTEIGLLLSAEDVSIPVFDTTREHVSYALDWAFG